MSFFHLQNVIRRYQPFKIIIGFIFIKILNHIIKFNFGFLFFLIFSDSLSNLFELTVLHKK